MVRDVANQGMPETEEAIGGMRDIAQRGQFTGQTSSRLHEPLHGAGCRQAETAAIRDFNRMGAARNAQAVNAGAFGGSRQPLRLSCAGRAATTT